MAERRWLWACLGFGLLLRGANAAEGPPPAPVVVSPVELREITPRQWVSATVLSLDDAAIPAEVEGRLRWVAEAGTAVNEGDVLARVDDSDIRLRIEEINADVARFGARITFLEQEAHRLDRLMQQNNTARTRFEEVQADRDATRAEQTAARARLERAKLDMSRAEIKAPFAGVIVERHANAGQWVDVGDGVVRLVNPARLEIRALVPNTSRQWLSKNVVLPVLSERGGIELPVRSLIPVGDPPSRLLDLRLPATGADLVVGEAVRVAIPIASSQKSIAVSRDALVLRRDGAAVFRLKEDATVERVPVEVGLGEGNFVAVAGNLKEGESVVIRGNERLRPGQTVAPVGGGAGSK